MTNKINIDDLNKGEKVWIAVAGTVGGDEWTEGIYKKKEEAIEAAKTFFEHLTNKEKRERYVEARKHEVDLLENEKILTTDPEEVYRITVHDIKEHLNYNNLTDTYTNRDNTVDLVFQLYGKEVVLRNAKIHLDENISKDSWEYENYFYEPENVDRAIEEAEEKDIEYIKKIKEKSKND